MPRFTLADSKTAAFPNERRKRTSSAEYWACWIECSSYIRRASQEERHSQVCAHKSDGNTAGGPAAIRGYLVQTLIALLESFQKKRPFSTIAIEPRNESEKIDILWEYEDGSVELAQVRSTRGKFRFVEVQRWTYELCQAKNVRCRASPTACVLWLVGECDPRILESNLQQRCNVQIEQIPLSMDNLWRHVWQGLTRFYESVDVTCPRHGALELIAKAMVLRLQEDSITRTLRTRKELKETFLEWAALTRISPLKVSPSRLPALYGKNVLGRDEELSRLDNAWSAALARRKDRPRVLSIIAWGGVGKTALAAHWMAKLAKNDWYGAEAIFDWSFYSQGTRESGAASATPFVAAALEFFGGDEGKELAKSDLSPWDKGAELARRIGRLRGILVLDGLEPLQYLPGPASSVGALRDQALVALLRGLAQSNEGLCLITTRWGIKDLDCFVNDTAPAWILQHLSPSTGVQLLKALGVRGKETDLEHLAIDVAGHALTLTLLGRYLDKAHMGDIGCRDHINLMEVDAKIQGGHAFKVIAAYERWFEESGMNGKRALAALRLLGLFDRPADSGCLDALRRKPSIPFLTESLVGLDRPDWNLAIRSLVDCGLITSSGNPESLDAHPLVREYFADQLQKQNQGVAWTAGHARIYEYLTTITKDKARPTMEDIQPLFHAVIHAGRAGQHQRAFEDIYWRRLARTHESLHTRVIGVSDQWLACLSIFFETPWQRLRFELSDEAKAYILEDAGHYHFALGKLDQGIQLLQRALKARKKQRRYAMAAKNARLIREIYLLQGDLRIAQMYAEESVLLAWKSNNFGQQVCEAAGLGQVLHYRGNVRAAAYFREARAVQKRRAPEQTGLFGSAGFWYCEFLLDRNNVRRVLRCANYLIFQAKSRGWIMDVGHAYLIKGRALALESLITRKRAMGRALGYLNAAIQRLQWTGQQHHMAYAFLVRTEVRRLAGRHAEAWSDLERGREIADRCEMRLLSAECDLETAFLLSDIIQSFFVRSATQRGEVFFPPCFDDHFEKSDQIERLRITFREARDKLGNASKCFKEMGYVRLLNRINEVRASIEVMKDILR